MGLYGIRTNKGISRIGICYALNKFRILWDGANSVVWVARFFSYFLPGLMFKGMTIKNGEFVHCKRAFDYVSLLIACRGQHREQDEITAERDTWRAEANTVKHNATRHGGTLLWVLSGTEIIRLWESKEPSNALWHQQNTKGNNNDIPSPAVERGEYYVVELADL